MFTNPLKIMQFQERVRQLLLPFAQIIDEAADIIRQYSREMQILDREIVRLEEEKRYYQNINIIKEEPEMAPPRINPNLRINERLNLGESQELENAKNRIFSLQRQIDLQRNEIQEYAQAVGDLQRELDEAKRAKERMVGIMNIQGQNEKNRIITEYETRLTNVINMIKNLKSGKGSFLIETRPYQQGKKFSELDKRKGSYYLAGTREKVNEIFKDFGVNTQQDPLKESTSYVSKDKQMMIKIKPRSNTTGNYLKFNKNTIFGDI